jgi:hypothetical protein
MSYCAISSRASNTDCSGLIDRIFALPLRFNTIPIVSVIFIGPSVKGASISEEVLQRIGAAVRRPEVQLPLFGNEPI